jgi:hypothetical protein
MIRILTMLLGAGFFLQGLGWIVAPAHSAERLGMPLLDGLGRSSQIGDFAALFLTPGATMLVGNAAGRARLLLVPAGMLASAAEIASVRPNDVARPVDVAPVRHRHHEARAAVERDDWRPVRSAASPPDVVDHGERRHEPREHPKDVVREHPVHATHDAWEVHAEGRSAGGEAGIVMPALFTTTRDQRHSRSGRGEASAVAGPMPVIGGPFADTEASPARQDCPGSTRLRADGAGRISEPAPLVPGRRGD